MWDGGMSFMWMWKREKGFEGILILGRDYIGIWESGMVCVGKWESEKGFVGIWESDKRFCENFCC